MKALQLKPSVQNLLTPQEKIHKAVILAAGMGSRMSSGETRPPKPLMNLSQDTDRPITFLDFHICVLEALGVSEIYLVGNQKTYETSLPAMQGRNVQWILNPSEDLSLSGSGHSTWYAWHSEHGILDENSRVLLMDADIVYDPEIFVQLSNSPLGSSCTLINPVVEKNNEEVCVFGQTQHTACLHGKGLHGHPMTQDLHCLGEATGVILWDKCDHTLLKEVTNWLIHYSSAKTRIEHEDITQKMLALGKVTPQILTGQPFFMEVDSPEEFEQMMSRFSIEDYCEWTS